MKWWQVFRVNDIAKKAGIGLDQVKQVVASYDPQLHKAPVVIGHPKHNAPAYAWVGALALDGSVLQANPQKVHKDFAELVRQGLYEKVSASFYPPGHDDNPTPGQWHLRHVGFLGATPPRIKGLKGIEFNEESDGCVTLEFSEEDFQAAPQQTGGGDPPHPNAAGDIAESRTDGEAGHASPPFTFSEAFAETKLGKFLHAEMTKLGLTTADMAEAAGLSAPEMQAIFDGARASESALAGIAKRLSTSLETLTDLLPEGGETTDMAELKETVDAQAQRIAELEREVDRSQLKEFVESLSEQIPGKSMPLAVEILLAADADKPEAVSFSEGDTTVKLSQRDALKRLLQNLPKLVEFSEVAGAAEDVPDTEDPVAISKAMQKMIDDGDAADFAEASVLYRRKKAAS